MSGRKVRGAKDPMGKSALCDTTLVAHTTGQLHKDKQYSCSKSPRAVGTLGGNNSKSADGVMRNVSRCHCGGMLGDSTAKITGNVPSKDVCMDLAWRRG